MNMRLCLPAILVALQACVLPCWAHRDPDPETNLVMLPGVTIASDGDLPGGYAAANAILNAPRTPDADGYQVLFANSWQGAAVYDPAARQHLTITFPAPVTIKGIAWNSGGCENGFYGGGVWKATLDGAVVVNDKTIATGDYGGCLHVPYGADPGGQHEIARFNPKTGTQLVLEFPVTQRGPAYNYSIRDINVEPYAAATALIDRSSMTNKVLCGYQGWFLCPGDGNASWWGWNHWSKQSDYIGPGTYNTEIWPDTREYDASDLFPVSAGTTLTDGGTPVLFSSARQGAVNVHFRWMQENGIDGVFHQIFVGGYNVNPNDDVQRKLDTVLQNVMNAANTYGRVFAVEYDISGVADSDIYNKLTGHWTYVSNAFDVKNHPRYLYHNGKPVVVIWGFGFNDTGHPGTTTTANSVITWFKNNGCFVIGGVPGKWRTLDGDSRSGTAWRNTYRAFNGLTPWTVGRYSTASEITTWKSRVSADITACNTYGQWYMPTAWPRFGWDNMNGYPCGQSKIASRGGQHFWDQLYAWKSAGARCQFIAMFDEYDESTAIMKLTDNVPTTGCWWTTEGKGEDWYLRLANWASRMQRGEIPVSQTIPVSSSTSPDNATIVTNTIPATMNAGQAYSVSVTVKNTGETCWNAEFFKLAAVGDSDPFATARQLMPSGTTVKTNQTYTFSFTMTAPATTGTYTSDWRMVHEVIRWFGGTWVKTVTVVAPVHLTVHSLYGGADPGTLSANYNTALSQFITNSPVSGGVGTQYVCLGAAVAGNAFTQVSPTHVNLALTNDATLTWLWATNCFLTLGASDFGGVDRTSGWYRLGSNVVVSATPSPDYHFAAWEGDVPEDHRTNNPLVLLIDAPKAVTAVFAVDRADQGIGFPNPGAQYTTNVVTLSATATSGLAVVFGVAAGPAQLAGATLTFTNAGTVSVVASQPGNGNWNAAAPVTNTFNVTKAAAGVTLAGLSQAYDGTAKAVTVTTVPSGLSVAVTYNGSTCSPTNAGSYAVTGTVGAAEAMYQGKATGTLVVARAASSTAVSSSQNPSVYGASVMFTATVNSAGGTPAGTVQFKTNGADFGSAVTLSGGQAANVAISTLPVGSTSVTAVYSGDANFNGSTSAVLSQTVTGALVIEGCDRNEPWIRLSWTGATGCTYTVEFTPSLAPLVPWAELPGCIGIPGVSGAMGVTDTNPAAATRFYRMKMNP